MAVGALLQVVVVKGSNPAGACIVAHQLYSSIPAPMPESSFDQLKQAAEASGWPYATQHSAVFCQMLFVDMYLQATRLAR